MQCSFYTHSSTHSAITQGGIVNKIKSSGWFEHIYYKDLDGDLTYIVTIVIFIKMKCTPEDPINCKKKKERKSQVTLW